MPQAASIATNPAWPHEISVTAIGAGAIAIVLVAAPYKVFDLDRYFLPKELILHLTTTIAIITLMITWRRAAPLHRHHRTIIGLTRTDTLLAAFLVLSAISAVSAPNRWLAARALAISASGMGMFWVAQALARAGRGRALMALLGASVTVAAATALLQAYGVESEYFSINRSPGGTLGNRNFVAHLAAIAMPTLIVATLRARRSWTVAPGAVAVAILAAALVLSRSRAAWVATALCALCILPTAIRSWRVQRDGRPGSSPDEFGRRRRHPAAPVVPALPLRGAILGVAVVTGVCSAIAFPNTLNWRSASPYLDSVVGVTNYRGGSGRGRLVQYGNTARLAITHPVLGVGPGNWAVTYPRVASRNDPSLDPEDGMTANPWPSSDWAAFVSERGLPATACLALGLLGLLVGAGRSGDEAARNGRIDRLLPALALSATVIALIVVGAFDAVLLLPAPSLIAWAALGTLAGTLIPAPPTRLAVPLPATAQGAIFVVVLLAGGLAVAHSSAQVVAMVLYTSAPAAGAGEHSLELAARADPGSYRIQVRLAEAYLQRRSCIRARPHATAARSLFPNALEPRHVLAVCGRAR